MIRYSFLVLALLTTAAGAQPGAPSDAELDAAIAKVQAEAPSLKTVARGTLRRARRAISIGPTVGVWSAAFLDPGELDAALTFGIGLETFKVPVLPSVETLKTLIAERMKAQLKDRIKAAFQGKPVDPIALDTMAAQIYQEVRDEVLGLENVRAKTMERPQYTIGFEANRLFGAERWLGRTRVGIGVWKLTVGLSAAVGRVCRGGTCDDGIKAFVGPELVAHFLTSKNPRASVVDVFARADFQASGRGVETYDQLVLGARFLLDLI